jgi:hypothetical protein
VHLVGVGAQIDSQKPNSPIAQQDGKLDGAIATVVAVPEIQETAPDSIGPRAPDDHREIAEIEPFPASDEEFSGLLVNPIA